MCSYALYQNNEDAFAARLRPGTVYLLGAGPGDPGLLTLRARDVLARADVVVYDYLANRAFLAFCSSSAELIYAGKKGGDHTLSQEAINQLLIDRAKQGLRVARLKGGDPYVFGRGAEEAEEFVDAGIDFEVVPGVTSAVAAPAYAGIPLTHRRFASSVSFITGHEDPDKPASSINWSALAAGGGTLVFFMGVRNLRHICHRLTGEGMDPQTPAGLVRWGTTCRQASLTGSLDSIAELAEQQGFKAPALLVVGQVVSLRDRLSWFERRPLLGRGVVITRAREQASSLVRLLEEEGACCLEFPTIDIRPLPDSGPIRQAIRDLAGYSWVVFTSVNGVEYFWSQIASMGLDSRIFGGIKVAAIGPATAESLKQRGIRPDLLPEKYVAESVVQGMLELGVRGEKVLLPRAETAREVLPESLRQAGASVDILPVYRTELSGGSPDEVAASLADGQVDYITFTSSSTVENFFQRIQPDELSKLGTGRPRLACIGPITSETLASFGFQADLVASEYTIPGLVEALIQDAHKGQAAEGGL